MLRLVQTGRGEPRPVLFLFLVGEQCDADIRAAIGDTVCVVADVESHGTESYQTLLAWARSKAGFKDCAGVYLGGWSNGCSRVRGLLLGGADPCGVLCLDGTHASVPPEQWQIDVWQKLAERARTGERQFVATCTQMSYVERLPVGTVGRATSTRHVLERVTGCELPPGWVVADCALYVESHPSADVDAAAHEREQREHLPRLLRDFVRPWLEGMLCPPTIRNDAPAPVETPPPWRDQTLSLGVRCLRWCEAEMAAGVKEEPDGSNTGPRIREYLAPCMRAGRALGLRAGAWCAAAQCAAQRASLLDGEYGVHDYVASGQEIEQSARSTGAWRPPSYSTRVGDLCILQRHDPAHPDQSWTRHVVRVREVRDDECQTIGGNENNAWGLSTLRYDDARITCWICGG